MEFCSIVIEFIELLLDNNDFHENEPNSINFDGPRQFEPTVQIYACNYGTSQILGWELRAQKG